MSGSVKLPAAEVDWLLRGALAAASKDDVTPVLCAVHWAVQGGRVTATATDRYRVHQLYSKRLLGDDPAAVAGEFLMSRRQAELLLSSLPRRRAMGLAVVELSWTDAEALPPTHTGHITRRYTGSVHFCVASDDTPDAERLSHDGPQVRGNFPPVERLFPDESATDGGQHVTSLVLDPRFLADTRWLRSGHGSLRFVVPRVGTGRDRDEPVLVVNTEGTARALVQPSLLVDEKKRYGDG